MCTTDRFQGFRRLTHFPTVALAVSQSNRRVPGKAYDAPAGWHWATAAEVKAVPGWSRQNGVFNYHSQGGWEGYRWEGVARYLFLFRKEAAVDSDGLRWTVRARPGALQPVAPPTRDRSCVAHLCGRAGRLTAQNTAVSGPRAGHARWPGARDARGELRGCDQQADQGSSGPPHVSAP
jgi:hypothetical protein